MDFGVGGEVDDGAEIVVKTFVRLKRLEHLDQLHRTEDIRILGRDLDNNLEVLTNVDTQHFLHASKRLLGSETTEVVHKPLQRTSERAIHLACIGTNLGRENVGVHDYALDIREILV